MTGKQYSIDRPCVTVMAAGMGGDSLGHWHFIEDPMIPKEQRTRPARQLFDAQQAKPEYRVPLMSEVARVKWNGLTVASTFAGCGGSSTGYRMAGYRVVWANEFVPAAQDSYRANMRDGTILDGRDIRVVTAAEILAATGLKRGQLDVFDGSPPCQAFSTAGQRERGWGTEKKYEHGASQRNEDLFFEYVRLRDGLQPRVFVAENVSGLVKGKAKGYFLEILRALKVGYRVEARLLDAQWLGVPQARQRIIFVGVRDDLAMDPVFPAPLPYRYSVRDAIPWLSGVTAAIEGANGFNQHAFQSTTMPAATAQAGRPLSIMVQGPEVDQRNKGRPINVDGPAPAVVAGDASKRTPRQFEVEITGRLGTGYKRRPVNLAEPSPTIMASGAEQTRFEVETRVVPGDRGNRRRREEGTPHELDEPITCVLADGGRKNSAQFMVETRVVHATGRKGQKAKDITDRPCPTITAGPDDPAEGGGPRNHFMIENGADISGQAIGREYDKLNPGQQSDKYFSLVRADAAEPSPTITASGGQNSSIACVIHPTEKRKFTIAELRRICSFPDDFILTGSYGQQWERLGNSVPPTMMMHIAAALRDGVLKKKTAARSIRTAAVRKR